MGHAYTPGLKATRSYFITKRRILPIKGEVVAKLNDPVSPDDVVARTYLPGNVEPMNIANILSVDPQEVRECMLKREGERVAEGEIIAKSKGFLGLFQSSAKAKRSGKIENISDVTGQVMVRGDPIPIEIKAYVKGIVTEIIVSEGVVISTGGMYVQGIFGVGGETSGLIKFTVKDNSDILTPEKIPNDSAGKVLIGGAMVTADAIRKAISQKASGIVTGGFDDRDLRDFLGYDLGVAITGQEKLGLTLIVTEGFGKISMAPNTFNLLKENEGKLACINGATQIRAGVIRPEIIVPEPIDESINKIHKSATTQSLSHGSKIRIIREPYFGHIGFVNSLPPELTTLESGSKARIVDVRLENDRVVTIPRANIEMIEE